MQQMNVVSVPKIRMTGNLGPPKQNVNGALTNINAVRVPEIRMTGILGHKPRPPKPNLNGS